MKTISSKENSSAPLGGGWGIKESVKPMAPMIISSDSVEYFEALIFVPLYLYRPSGYAI
jgi:uncharacterized spore protein YtfJ